MIPNNGNKKPNRAAKAPLAVFSSKAAWPLIKLKPHINRPVPNPPANTNIKTITKIGVHQLLGGFCLIKSELSIYNLTPIFITFDNNYSLNS